VTPKTKKRPDPLTFDSDHDPHNEPESDVDVERVQLIPPP